MVKSAFIGKRNRAANLRLYRRLLSKARRTIILQRRKREKLNAYFEDIVNNVSIDYSNPEIKDIQSAVLELLNRVTAKINERGLFKILRIHPCGSMAEKTSLWKNDIDTGDKTEFDFLAILEAPGDCQFVESCLGCMRVSCCPILDVNLMHRFSHAYPRLYAEKVNEKWFEHGIRNNTRECIETLFKLEIWAVLVSFCNCFSSVEMDIFPDFSKQLETGCKKCTVSRPNGRLRFETSDWAETNCSLMLSWTSNTMSLLAPDRWTLQKTRRLKRLQIAIDFLPALELFKSDKTNDQTLEHKLEHCFIVPKGCPYRDGVDGYYSVESAHAWRISHCMAEVNHFVKIISNKHKKCYKVLKYLFALEYVYFIDFIEQYHIKTAVLNHSIICSNSSEDCAKCVVEIVRELRDAYKCRVLTAFNGQANVIGGIRISERISEQFEEELFEGELKRRDSLLTLMTKFKSRKTFENTFDRGMD